MQVLIRNIYKLINEKKEAEGLIFLVGMKRESPTSRVRCPYIG